MIDVYIFYLPCSIKDVFKTLKYIKTWTINITVSVFWREEGCTMKCSLSTRAKPKGFPEGSGYISLYIPTWVTIQTFSITVHCSEDSWLVKRSRKLAPNKVTDWNNTKISNINVCRYHRFCYSKFWITCRHKHIEKECEVNGCDNKCLNKHIKACCYGSCCKIISLCAFKHIEKEKHSKRQKL